MFVRNWLHSYNLIDIKSSAQLFAKLFILKIVSFNGNSLSIRFDLSGIVYRCINQAKTVSHILTAAGQYQHQKDYQSA